jgi:hypothetical protein
MPNPLTDKQFVRLLDDRLDKVFTLESKGLPSVIEKIYTRRSTKKAWEEFFGIGDIPDPEPFHGIIQYQSISPGYHTKIEPKEYAGGITVQRRLIDTDRYDVIEGRTKGLARAMNRKMNKIAHEPFIYPDSAAFTFVVSEEGVALASNSHTTKAPDVSTTSGFDNLATYAFDAANLEALRLQTKGFRDDIGERYDSEFDTIVFPSALAEAVWEVGNSPGKTGDNLNNRNFQEGRWKFLELPMLDDYSTTGWGILDSSKMKEELIWLDAVKTEFNSTSDFDTMMRKYASYAVFAWGFTGWRWMCWSDPS